MTKSAELLKQWRDSNGFSQSQAAQFLQIPVRTLQNWEQGRAVPYPKILELALKSPRQ